MKHQPTYTRSEVLARVAASTDLEELEGLASLVLEEALLYEEAVYSELVYHLHSRSERLIQPIASSVGRLSQALSLLNSGLRS